MGKVLQSDPERNNRQNMTPTYSELAALSMDVKRIALAYHENSLETGDRFVEESLKKIKVIDSTEFPKHVKKILNSLEKILLHNDKQKVAEDALMYSTILQNASLCSTHE